MWLKAILTVVISYLLGNINGAICASKLLGDDVRTHGSGNAGLTNFIRSYGAGKSAAVIGIDAGKAIASCLLGGFLLMNQIGFRTGAAMGGVAVLIGHMLPVLLDFRGGKGILSGLFVALVVDWRIALLIVAVFALAYFTTWYVSLGSVLAAVAFGVGFVVFHHNNLTVMFCGILMSVMAIVMHWQNILRLVKGEERKTNLFK